MSARSNVPQRPSPLLWVPFLLVAVGVVVFFYLDTALPPPISLAEKEGTFALWGSFLLLGYLIHFLQRHRRRPVDRASERAELPARASRAWPALASAGLLAVGFLLLFAYVFLTSGGCLARGACATPTTIPWTHGLLTPVELVELVLALTSVGTVLLVVSTWQLERASVPAA